MLETDSERSSAQVAWYHEGDSQIQFCTIKNENRKEKQQQSSRYVDIYNNSSARQQKVCRNTESSHRGNANMH